MAEKDFLEVSQRLQIEIKTGSYAGKYHSRIEDLSENTITIGAPFHHGAIVPVNPGQNLLITAIAESALYNFSSLILEKKQEPLPVLIVTKPESMQKVQRRSFFRVKADIPISYRVLPNLTAPSFGEFKQTKSIDISGGGVLLLTDEPFGKETILELKIDLPKHSSISAVARVVFLKDTQRPDKKKEIATEFVIIEESDREKIVKFIFEKQREDRKKELKWVDRLSS